MSQQTAELLYPSVPNISDILDNIESREDQIVTRLAPSPTGFLHIWSVYTGLLNSNIAHQKDGIFMLRIEDTDQARNTTDYQNKTWWVYSILDGFKYFGLEVDEGVMYRSQREIAQSWGYGPYIQSERLDIYKIFIKYLITQDLAYPCFLTSDQLEQIRESQIISKSPTWVYGEYAISRNLTYEEIIEYIDQGKDFSVRLKSPGSLGKRIGFDDEVKGHIEIDDNYEDVVLMKSDGFPTYHFAHIVDDYMMGVTHVIRTDERLPSVPKHIQIYSAFVDVFTRPIRKYAHPGPLMKIDQGNKRKLSKRKDPEADVEMWIKDGIPPNATKVYLMGLMDSGYEPRWFEHFVENKNSDLDIVSYDRELSKINGTWAMVDMQKLAHICSEYIASVWLDKLIMELESYMKIYPNSYIFEDNRKIDKDYLIDILSFDRQKKIHTNYNDIIKYILPFADDYFDEMGMDKSLLSGIDSKIIADFLSDYRDYISSTLFDWNIIAKTKEERFEDLKTIWKDHWFATNNAEFKEGGYIWRVGDLAMILRVLLYGSTNTPDIYEMIKVMWKDRVLKRLNIK